MKKQLTAKRWIAFFLILSVLFLTFLASVAYIIDPFFQFRVKDNSYFLTAPYVNAGLIKNHDYDTLIVGSCMIGSFDMNQFRNELGLNPLKAESGSMGPNSIAAYINYAASVGKAKHYFVNIDLASYQAGSDDIINHYLMKTDFLSRFQYLLGYDTWFRFIPVDCGLMLYKSILGDFPSGKMTQRTSIDFNGTGRLEEKHSRAIVVRNREAHLYEVSPVVLENLQERFTEQIDSFISQIDFSAGSFTFIFPPYSTLYWCDAQDLGYFDAFMSAKDYFIQELLARNCTVYDFQSADVANDLDNYKDSTHYSPAINAWMTECFASEDYLVTAENQSFLQEQLLENTKIFRAQNPDLFN